VEVGTLDQLLQARWPGYRVVVLKVDIEGHEDKFLRGALRTLQQRRPVIFIEWNRVYYERRGIDPTSAVTPLLTRLDYRCWRRSAGAWCEQQRFRSPRELDDLVLVPAGMSPPKC
jgi:hypothetical protein